MKDFFAVGMVMGEDMNTLQTFFEHYPHAEHICLIILQHPSTSVSKLDELLSTTMPKAVCEIEGKTPLLPNKIYTISPQRPYKIFREQNQYVIQYDNKLHAGIENPVNIFYSSLAALFRQQFISILLNGKAITKGTEEVHHYGGKVLAVVDHPAKPYKLHNITNTDHFADFEGTTKEVADHLRRLATFLPQPGVMQSNDAEAYAAHLAETFAPDTIFICHDSAIVYLHGQASGYFRTRDMLKGADLLSVLQIENKAVLAEGIVTVIHSNKPLVLSNIRLYKNDKVRLVKLELCKVEVQQQPLVRINIFPEQLSEQLYATAHSATVQEASIQSIASLSLEYDEPGNKKQANNLIKHSHDPLVLLNEKLKLVIASSKVGIWELDLANGSITWNDNAALMFDFKDKPFDHQQVTIYKRIHPEDIEKVQEAFQDCITHQTAFDVEYRIVHEDGSIIYTIAHGVLLTNEQGEPVKMLGTNFDYSDLRKNENTLINARQQLRISEERLEYAVQGTSDGIWDWTDLDQTKLWWSPKYYELLGFKDQEIESSFENLEKRIHPDDKALHNEVIQRRLTADGTHEIEFRILHKTLGYRWFLSRGKAFKNEFGKPIRLAGSLSDIQARKMAELQYDYTYEKLKRANEYLDNIVFTVAHDLSSPVANLISLVALLKTRIQNDDPVVERIDLSVIKLEQTLRGLIQILDIHQTESKAVTAIYFHELLENFTKEMENTISDAKVEITFSFQVKQIVYIYSFIEKIVRNLLGNAIKYIKPDKPAKIHIHTEQHKEYVLLTVTDNGIGMDLDRFKDKIFKPFERLSNESTGQGIGLHLIKSIIEKNGGKVEVQSTLNVGTTFKVYLRPYA